MTRRQLTRRLRALSTDERGFSLLETMIAIVVIFGSILTLAFASLASFRYQGVARQRQAANGVAARVMEDIRGLAYARVTSGLLSTDLTGDPNIVDCSGTYRFLSCTPGSDAGSGEVIVHNPGLQAVAPLVPHRSTSSTSITQDGVRYDWATYVTRDDAITTAPYRVTVVVTWTEGFAGGAKYVRIQSLFWSPAGCRDLASHPFAAPCQPFLLGNATVPNGGVSTTGTIDGITFSSLEISLMGVTATSNQEQISGAQGSVHAVQATVVDGTSTRNAGGATASSDADLDPNTTAGSYSRVRCATEITCTGATLTSPIGGGDTYVQLTVPTTTVGETASAAQASAGSPCPPSVISATAENDNQPCSGAAVQQSATMNAIAHLHDVQGLDLGDATIARVAAAGTNQARAFSNRVVNPAPVGAVCAPAAGTNGCVSSTANRTYGNIRLAQLPDELSWELFDPFWDGSCNGFFMSLVSYADSATASAGEGTPLPTAPAPTGSFYYYDQGTGTCRSLALSAIGGLNVTYTDTATIDGTDVTVTISTVPEGMIAPSTSTNASPATTGSPQPTRFTSSASSVAPKLTVRTTITIPGRTLMDLTQVVALGTLEANATYEPAPSST